MTAATLENEGGGRDSAQPRRSEPQPAWARLVGAVAGRPAHARREPLRARFLGGRAAPVRQRANGHPAAARRAPLTLIYRVLFKWVEWSCGISLPYTVRLGRRVRIWHHSGMILHARAIGDETQIRQNTTFGLARVDRPLEIPTIGARVDIGCGVCILGRVTVGNDSRIGANAVVLADVPAGATAVGVPARIIPGRVEAAVEPRTEEQGR